jgi:hypothetical protein
MGQQVRENPDAPLCQLCLDLDPQSTQKAMRFAFSRHLCRDCVQLCRETSALTWNLNAQNINVAGVESRGDDEDAHILLAAHAVLVARRRHPGADVFLC